MHVFTSKDYAPLAGQRPALTIGVFDGVHRGHQTIFKELIDNAKEMAVPAMAITFSQHPRLTLGRSAPLSIHSLENRLRLMERAGLNATWVLDFSPEMAVLPGWDFSNLYFHERLDSSLVVLGQGAHFGRDRDGNAHNLAKWAKNWHMKVIPVPALIVDGTRVSSTAIRLAVQSGNLDRAEQFLGRRFSVIGTVVHGQGLAKSYGFPTLNLDPHHELRPPAGVYVTTAQVGGKEYPSVTNVGRPPTDAEIEAGLGDFMVETHLLGYDGDLYDQVAEVFFIKKIRDVMRFAEPTGLIRQVRLDMAEAKDYFKAL